MAEYTKPELRERIKEKLQASDKGGGKGEWSARKSQLLVQEYEKHGGGYVGDKDERQKSLEQWGDEEWQTGDGDSRARTKDGTKRYLPKEAWDELSEAERKATDDKKRKGDEQHVANTKAAKQARKEATKG